MVHVGLLGPLVVTDDDGNDLTPPGQRERACVAILAVMAPEAVSTERLAAELYRDRETSDPRNAVQAVVSRLRRALGRSAGSIETTGTGYRMVDVDLDIDRVDDLLRAAAVAGEPERSNELLDRAGAQWRGPSFDGLEGDLLDAERLRIDGLRADVEDAVLGAVVEGLTGGDRTDGIPVDLLARLERAVRDEPLRERRWELLMIALYRTGRQADALRAFQRARTVLADRLGLDPGPALVDLEARILAHEPALRGGLVGRDGADDDAPVEIDSATGSLPPALPPALPAGTVTVLLCDVEGSVERWEAAPGSTAASIARMHDIWSDATADHGGHVVKSTGDGVLAVFATPAAAMAAAADAMVAQAATDLVVSAAITSGSLQPIDGDYRGPTVNRCARLLELAHGGQILAGAAAAELARGDLPPDVTIRELGLHWLRDVPEPMAVVQIGGPGLRAEFPALESRGPESLPRPRGELLGRSELVVEVEGLVDDRALVTLLGPGGIGKTSLALAAAWMVAGRRPVVFVDLARLTEPDEVAHQIAAQVAPAEDDDLRSPAQRLADRLALNTDLVVVDNAEHVLDRVAELLDEVLRRELKGSFLVTSRQPLGLVDEHLVALPPLALPATDDDLVATGATPAVRLFVDRVRSANPTAELTAGRLPAVAHICRRLDGIPLAIELAAGRASMLSVEDIAGRLDDQLRLLRQRSSARDRRHRSLEAVVGWSLDLLSRSARELFDRLSVMAGSFGLDAVEALVDRCELDWVDPLEDLGELVDACLVVVEVGGSRYRMLEPLRQVAAAELDDRGLTLATRRAHARWVLDRLTVASELRDERRAVEQAAIGAEADQLRAAVAFVGDEDQIDLIPDLAYASAFWFLSFDARAGQRLLTRLTPLVSRDHDPLAWAKTILAEAVVTVSHPRHDLAGPAREALAVFDDHDHPDRGLIRVVVAFCQGDETGPELPTRLLEEADRLVSSDDRYASAIVDMGFMVLASLLRQLGVGVDLDLAVTRGDRAIAEFRVLGEKWALGVALGEIGRIHSAVGHHELAEERFLESIELFEVVDYHGTHYVFTELGTMASARGDHDRALAFHTQALAAAESYGHQGCVATALAGLAQAAEARSDLDEAVDYYRQALDAMADVRPVDFGWQQWRDELARLEADSRRRLDRT